MKNTFPFETANSVKKLSLTVCAIMSGILTGFFVLAFDNDFKFGFFITTIIFGSISSISFLLLNLTTFNKPNVHFAFDCTQFISTILLSTSLGFVSLKLNDLEPNFIFIIFAIVNFVLSVIELFLVSPAFKFSLKMEEDKKPDFIRLAFYEWLFNFLLILHSIILLVIILL